MCVIVDEQNNVVGAATRHETVSRRLLGRGSYVLLFNARGELFVSKRSAAKDVYPGALDVVISGVVNQGESYADTAIRELEEEVGVPPSHSQQHLRQELIFPYEDEVCRVFGTVFSLTFDGALVFADAEVESGRFVGLEELARQLRERPADFTPVGRHILGLWLSDRRRQQQHVEQERQSDQRSG